MYAKHRIDLGRPKSEETMAKMRQVRLSERGAIIRAILKERRMYRTFFQTHATHREEWERAVYVCDSILHTIRARK